MNGSPRAQLNGTTESIEIRIAPVMQLKCDEGLRMERLKGKVVVDHRQQEHQIKLHS